jgi:hypothetical protein
MAKTREEQLKSIYIKVRNGEINRLTPNLTAVERETQAANFEAFRERALLAESSGDYGAINIPKKGEQPTTASGGYQIVKGSAIPALNRLKRLLKSQGLSLKDIPELDKFAEHKDAKKLSPIVQDMLITADWFQKTLLKTEARPGWLYDMDKEQAKKLQHDKDPGAGDRLWRGILGGDNNSAVEFYDRGHHTGKTPADRAYSRDKFGDLYNETISDLGLPNDPIADAINRTNGIAEQDMFPLYV